jgi:hypothetical protein
MSPSTDDLANRQRLEGRLRTVLDLLARLADEAAAAGLARTELALRRAHEKLIEEAKARHGVAL